MGVGYVVVTIVLAVIATGSAVGKLTRQKPVVDVMTAVGVPGNRLPVLAGLEIAGAVGLLVGFAVPAIGVAAAIGLVLYFLGAAIAHLRIRDAKGTVPPAALCAFAVVALVLRLAV